MLKWIAKPVYNRFDPVWLCLVALAWRDQHWFAMAVFMVVGILVSATIEVIAKHRSNAGGNPRERSAAK